MMREYAEVSLRLEPTFHEKLVAQIQEFHARVSLESQLGVAAAWTSRAA